MIQRLPPARRPYETGPGPPGTVGGVTVHMRTAEEKDLAAIVALLADDALGAARETPGDLDPYRAAFQRIAVAPGELLVVAVDGEEIVGTMQLTFLPGLSHRGATRCQIEAVRVASSRRGGGLGGEMISWAIQAAREQGAALVQLTSSSTRRAAHGFYERLGFQPTHVGFKLHL